MSKVIDWRKSSVNLENNRPIMLGECTPEVRAASNWIAAIDAWDYCDPSLLGEMLRRHALPIELQPIIAGIVTGERKQNTKARLNIPAQHRLSVIGMYASARKEFVDVMLDRKGRRGDYHDTADRLGVEVDDLRKEYLKHAREFKQGWADMIEVSTEVLDARYRERKQIIKKYPNI